MSIAETTHHHVYDPPPGSRFRGFSSASLKTLALVTMFIDHAAFILLEPLLSAAGSETTWIDSLYQVSRLIGRLAFPIYAFLIVVGFLHTRSPSRYLTRLLIFALLSEIPFNLAYGSLIDPQHQNVLWTFAISLVLLMALERWPKHLWLVLPAMAIAFALQTDYHAYGVLLVVYLYYFYDHPSRDLGGAILGLYQLTAALAFIPIHYFNGARGRQPRWLFYIFYPAHLLLLVLIRSLVLN